MSRQADVNQELLRVAERAAQEVTDVLSSEGFGMRRINSQVGKDVKAAGDARAHQILVSALAPTGFPILSEEDESGATVSWNRPCWVIDPLDGTFNYTRGFGMYAVSIAFWDGGRPIFGLVHDIPNRNLYRGIVGDEATCNGAAIEVSDITQVGSAAIATGFPAGRDYGSNSLERFLRSVQRYKKVRMLGSAALSLAHVATGHFDAYFEEDIWIWDVAAGMALVQAAGGTIETSAIKDDWKVDLVAWNGRFEPGVKE